MLDPHTAIRALHLSKTFDGRAVLSGLDIEIAAGEAVAICGANGSGKTTLLGCLASALRPTSGEVRWFGRPANDSSLRRWIGMAAHESGLYPHLTLRENLMFAARMSGIGDAGHRADEWLDRTGLAPYASAPPTRLSRGMRQRLAIARALIHDPPILLFDEPFTALDTAGVEWLMTLLFERRDRGHTMLFVTHENDKIQRLAQRVLELRDGRACDVTSTFGNRQAIRAA